MRKTRDELIVVAEPWDKLHENPVRNTKHDYLKFINSAVFSEEARHFLRYGYYTSAQYGTKDWTDYWDEQEERCLEGYSVGGVRITGRHYFFLNFSMLKARPIDPVTGLEKDSKKIITFPRFLDHQYYLFHEIEECFAEGPYKGQSLIGMIIAKARRKGISFVNSGGIISYNYNFIPASLTTIAAYEAVHYNTLLNGTHFVLNHLNKNTDWAKRRQRVNRRDHFRSSFVYTDNAGVELEDGFMSEVQAKSFKDDPFKAIGDSTYTMCFEECLGKGTKVFMFDHSFKNVEDIVVGDFVMGVDSKPKKVINTTSGVDNLFKIKQQKGVEYVVNSKHKLYLEQHTNITSKRFKNDDGPKLLNVNEFESLITYKHKCTYGIKSNGLEFKEQPLLIDPYAFGAWLGDGESSRFAVVVNTDTDVEILSYFKSVYPEHHLYTIKNINATCVIITPSKKIGNQNIQNILLKELGVRNNKHIPDCYQFNSEKNRLQVLAGLLDTDGYLQKGTRSYSYSYEIAVKNDLLADQIVLLARGLGFYVKKSRKYGKKDGKIHASNRLQIRGDLQKIPLKVLRKRPPIDWIPTSNPLNTQIKIEPVGKGKYFGFTLEGENDVDHLFLLEDFTITHNCGRFKGLLDAYTIAEPTFRDGDIMTGVPMLWGTGGDVEAGGKDLEEMFYKPEAYGLKSYSNIYDENAVGRCGWFIDDLWYKPGLDKTHTFPLVDKEGNSYRELTRDIHKRERDTRATGSRLAFRKHITQYPLTPKEAFLRIDSSPFDTLRAQNRLTDLLTDQKTYIDSIYTAKFVIDVESNKVKYEYDSISIPLREFPIKDWEHVEGCPEIYEHPHKNQNGEIQALRYIAGIDSYDADKSTTDSLGSIIVLDRLTDRIMCHYKGRPLANKFYETCRRILKYYNATANYERSNKGIYGHFYNMKCIHLLCDEPDILKEKGISKANTLGNSSKGTMPSTLVNAWGRELSAFWTEQRAYGEDDESEIVNMDKMRSLGILREILSYNDDGNFDDISALGMLMIYRENLATNRILGESKKITIMDDPFWKRHTPGFQPDRNSMQIKFR